ncbi:hypothetical protein [Methylobacterium sp. sgz302541]|uniref:hypothetical protein n=1 Tax=unclassified Methylobacterium TaxID=2615210 RepID=UPI003D335F41
MRNLSLGLFVAACAGIVGLVSADRLSHPGNLPVRRAALAEPSATGSIAAAPKAAAVAAKPAAAAIPNGFDTERLHALMRGDPIMPSRR